MFFLVRQSGEIRNDLEVCGFFLCVCHYYQKAVIVYFVMTDDPGKQKTIIDSIKPEIVLHTSAQRLRSLGYDINADKSTNYSFQRCVASEQDGKKAKELGELLPDKIAEKFVVAGRPEQCVAQLQDLVQAGARNLIIRDMLWANERRDFRIVLHTVADEIISVFA